MNEEEIAIEVREMSNEQLRDEFYLQQKRMEYIVDAIRFRSDNQRDTGEELPNLEDKGRMNEANTEFHLFLNLV